MRTRTLAREAALQYLYEIDAVGIENAEPIVAFLERQLGRTEAWDYATSLIAGCLENMAEIDKVLASCAENWTLERMAVVDRNVLRLGTYELLFAENVPHKVAINEAINLSRRFSTEESGSFVNGVLDRIRELAPDDSGRTNADGDEDA